MSRHCFLWLASLAILQAQTLVDLRTQSKSVDFTAAPSTKPFKAGTVLPAICSLGGAILPDQCSRRVQRVCVHRDKYLVPGGRWRRLILFRQHRRSHRRMHVRLDLF
jgi:hypothetical protein